jgi:hypothetical protein
MSEYDAFGRKKDEAGLSDLGWGTTDDPAAKPNPEPTAAPPPPPVAHPTVAQQTSESGFSAPAEFTSVPTGPPPMRRRRGRNPVVLLTQFLVLGGIALAIYFAVDAGQDAADKVRGAINGFNDLGGGNGNGGGRGDDTVPQQVKARKLFTAEGLRSAIKVMEREVPGKVTNFAIRRDRINATIISGGKSRFVNFASDAEVPEVLSTSTAGSTTGALSYEQINPTAPPRLMKAANARLGRSEADVDYFVVQNYTGAVQWGIYYEGGSPIAQGDSQGRYTRRIS